MLICVVKKQANRLTATQTIELATTLSDISINDREIQLYQCLKASSSLETLGWRCLQCSSSAELHSCHHSKSIRDKGDNQSIATEQSIDKVLLLPTICTDILDTATNAVYHKMQAPSTASTQPSQESFSTNIISNARQEAMETLYKEISTSALMSEWSRCLTGKHQADHLYRFGKFDDCGRQWQDVKTGIRLKFTRDKEKALDLWRGTYYRRSRESTTIGVIWEAKEKPGWE
jgi:Protein of unknown function (DUF3128)